MKSHRGISFLSVQGSPPSVEASLSLTLHISPLTGRSAGRKASRVQTMALTERLSRVGLGLPLRAVCKWS